MRLLRLFNRTDLATLSRGTAFDLTCSCGQVHTLQAEHAYKKARAATGDDASPLTPGKRLKRTKGPTRKTYTDRFKQAAVRRVQHGEVAAAVVRDLGISHSMLTAWTEKLGKNGKNGKKKA